jgi:hypothetical protein
VRGLPYVLRLMGAGLLRPKSRVPGTDVAGQVEAVGEDVTLFRPGNKVFGESVRGHQWHNGGEFAKALARAFIFERATIHSTSSKVPRGSSTSRRDGLCFGASNSNNLVCGDSIE